MSPDRRADSIFRQLGYPLSAFLGSTSRPNVPMDPPKVHRSPGAITGRSKVPHTTHTATAIEIPPLPTNQSHYDTAYHAAHVLSYEQAMEQNGYVMHSGDALMDRQPETLPDLNTVAPKRLAVLPGATGACKPVATGVKRPRARSAGARLT